MLKLYDMEPKLSCYPSFQDSGEEQQPNSQSPVPPAQEGRRLYSRPPQESHRMKADLPLYYTACFVLFNQASKD